ncbi:MAG: hypothetical protein NTX87_15855 [Planctomycetota bacterium]|nr:hypothetical protein [Planctomycetota bacterium]
MRTAVELTALVQQRHWDKDLVLWIGPEAGLLAALGNVSYVVLDLLDLFDENSTPPDGEEVRLHLSRAIRARLRAMSPNASSRIVLVVKSIGLLARYGVGVKDFYEWFCGDHAMVVLTLDGKLEKTSWPDEVVCDADRLLAYFKEPEMVKYVFGVKG